MKAKRIEHEYCVHIDLCPVEYDAFCHGFSEQLRGRSAVLAALMLAEKNESSPWKVARHSVVVLTHDGATLEEFTLNHFLGVPTMNELAADLDRRFKL